MSFLPFFPLISFLIWSNGTLGCYSTISDSNFFSPLPPELDVRAPAQDGPRHSLDDHPTIAGSERLSNGPTACEAAASNLHLLDVDVPGPGEAEEAPDGTLPNNGESPSIFPFIPSSYSRNGTLACRSTHCNELFHSTESPQLDAHKPSPLTPLLPPDRFSLETGQEQLPDNPTTRAESVSNIRSSDIDIPDAGEARNPRNGTFLDQGVVFPVFSFNFDSDWTSGSLGYHYSSPSKDFHSSPPPQRDARSPNAAASHTAHDERPPNIRSGSLQNAPVTRVEGVSDVRPSNVAVSNAGGGQK